MSFYCMQCIISHIVHFEYMSNYDNAQGFKSDINWFWNCFYFCNKISKYNPWLLFSFDKIFKNTIENLRIVSKYNNYANYSVKIKRVLSLGFVPIKNIDLATNLLADKLLDELIPLLDWLEKYNVGMKKIGKSGFYSLLPQFPAKIWNLK